MNQNGQNIWIPNVSRPRQQPQRQQRNALVLMLSQPHQVRQGLGNRDLLLQLQS